MSRDARQDDITKRVVVYSLPGMEAVRVRRGVEYRAARGGPLTFDIYYPRDRAGGARVPAVVFVLGYGDPAAEAMLGCKLKEMGAYVSWARLAAASGMAAVTYTNREPARDVRALLRHVRQNADALGIDARRIGLWACSGNVPTALSVLMRGARHKLNCAALCYGYMLDGAGETAVAEAAATWGFANPCAGRSIGDLTRDTPLLVVRAGQDQMPRLNETVDRFAAGALAHNLPLTLINHPAAPHAFDLFRDEEDSREVVRQILSFMRFHLSAAPAEGRTRAGSSRREP